MLATLGLRPLLPVFVVTKQAGGWNANKREAAKNGSTPWRNDPRYKAARLFVLNRDHWTCQMRLEGCVRKANTVHHKGGVSDANLCDTNIMVAACKQCNTKEGRPGIRNPAPVRRTQWVSVETS